MHTEKSPFFAFFVAVLLSLSPGCGSDDSNTETLGDEDREESASELEDPTGLFPRLKAENGQILDEYGRVVWLRGANAGSRAKMPPFLPWEGSEPGDEAFETDADRFYAFPEDWSMNVIRLTVFWEAVEPQRGSYDEEYLATIVTQIEAAAAHGLYVFVDFHQDLYSRILGGSGAPAWALPDPSVEEIPQDSANWFLRYFSDETIGEAFEHFWTNQNGVQDAYEAMVQVVVDRVAGQPNLMGIDLLNEPAPGTNRIDDFQGWFAEELVPFYTRLGKAIQDDHPELIVLVESSSAEAGGVDAGVMPMPDLDNLIFAPHYYNSIQFVMGVYDGDIENIEEGLGKWAKIGEELQVPILISEYGFRTTVEDRPKGNPGAYFDDHYHVMDSLKLHGTVWDHEVTDTYWNQEDCAFVNGDWTEYEESTNAVARPYPMFTSGDPISFEYDPKTHVISYRYAIVGTQGAPTVLRLPARHYATTPTVELAVGDWRFEDISHRLLIFDASGENESVSGTVQVVSVHP